MEKKPQWTGWKAIIHANEGGTYAIEWKDAPAMERRGGWSSPYDTIDDARRSVLEWIESWGMTPDDVTISVAIAV